MINRKTYIPITKNNRIRMQSISKSKPSNFKSRDDLNKQISTQSISKSKPSNFKSRDDLNSEISANSGKLKNKIEPMKIYGTNSISSDSGGAAAGKGAGAAAGGTPTETFAISASFITGNAGTGWGTAWKFYTNDIGNAVDRNGPLVPIDTYGGNRTLNFNLGDTIRFENQGLNGSWKIEEGVPFTIRNVPGVGTTDLAEGVVNNSSTLGPIFFTPVAPGTYYYNDSSDSSNGQGRNWGQIIINDINDTDSSFQYVNSSFESMFN